VVDEEHDASFKQQDGARYHGRDVAVLRARRLGIPIVLGSATPSLESLNNVRAGRYRLAQLTERAGQAVQPRWQVLDQRGQHGVLVPDLLQAIRRHLDGDGQVLLYRNRRGYAPVLMCNACGWQADCQRCSAHLTWHQKIARLQCHHCGSSLRQPPRCPDCGEPDLAAVGAGTERLEEILASSFRMCRSTGSTATA
jgi:primosomal protein N' (replication factor Y) (superfamily II helicase)